VSSDPRSPKRIDSRSYSTGFRAVRRVPSCYYTWRTNLADTAAIHARMIMRTLASSGTLGSSLQHTWGDALRDSEDCLAQRAVAAPLAIQLSYLPRFTP
jgi:hypothetical protein